MKKFTVIIIFVFSFILSACVPFYTNRAIKAPDRQFNEKLPNLEPVFKNEKEVKHWNPGEKIGKRE